MKHRWDYIISWNESFHRRYGSSSEVGDCLGSECYPGFVVVSGISGISGMFLDLSVFGGNLDVVG